MSANGESQHSTTFFTSKSCQRSLEYLTSFSIVEKMGPAADLVGTLRLDGLSSAMCLFAQGIGGDQGIGKNPWVGPGSKGGQRVGIITDRDQCFAMNSLRRSMSAVPTSSSRNMGRGEPAWRRISPPYLQIPPCRRSFA